MTTDVSKVRGWRDDDPSIFEITIVARLQGEFQVTNGYGPTKVAQVMKVIVTNTCLISLLDLRCFTVTLINLHDTKT